ncbi:hypothetical protein [Paenibacillus silvae]|uniref:Anti-sigma factor n=1 Tax=Paenibacillus silvae TaxID=1325358 RepID=A0ABQ1YX69_9BACL|nr:MULTISPECIES: hypothetical protein [Paenibacillus]MCK6076420.1 hypothetical protein [Paenibacillus silvae]MCK6150847.1 hypothetical protein [Paenibacillus silvae]MCK6269107.1 hypothetical protein [Paenibacillus silvae]GGH42144.1 hypothetical protein GCM10008014_02180 [Paenibacillus silvae]
MSKKEMYTVQQWVDYIEGRVSSNQAMQMEQHLLNEPDAMEAYLGALCMEREYPELPHPIEFTNTVMERIERLPTAGSIRPSRGGRTRRWFEQRAFHYAVAACLTLIFLSSGLFDKVAPYHKFQEGETAGSFTEKWTEAATSWLDNFKPKP